MTAYTATFQNGHTLKLKNSRREYTHAWRWVGTRPAVGPTAYAERPTVGGSGFAGSRELAEKAMASSSAFITTRPRTCKFWHPREVASWQPGTITEREIVEVVRG